MNAIEEWLSGWVAGEAAGCAACANLVRSAGCICRSLRKANDFRGTMKPIGARATMGRDGEWTIGEHDPRCPEALAADIEAQ